MAKKAEPKFRKLDKVDGKVKTKIGKFYQIGDKHSLKAEKVLKIETLKDITEHDAVDTLPTNLKGKYIKN